MVYEKMENSKKRLSNLHIIAAMSKNTGGIGYNNELLDRLSEDMKFFKETTTGNAVVMGPNTFNSLGVRAPLKNRVNIVITSGKTKLFLPEDEEIIILNNVGEVLAYALGTRKDVYIIGGTQVYNSFLEYASSIYLTEIYEKTPKQYDRKFPIFTDLIEERIVLKRVEEEDEEIPNYEIVKYILKE